MVDEALRDLRDTLEPRIGRGMTRRTLQSLATMREAPGATAPLLLQVIAQIKDSHGRRPPIGAPWSLAECRVIREAAVRKLAGVSSRAAAGLPLRGMLPDEARALAEHADALAPAFGEDPPEFRVSIAYANAFTYSHHLIFGEPFDRNDPTPIWALAQAAERQRLERDGRQFFVPVSWVRDHGVIWAIGLEPSPRLDVPWSPGGLLFVPDRGRSLRLDDTADLQAFLAELALDVRATTLASLIWVLAAPFPWDACPELDAGLVDLCVGLEAEHEARRFQGDSAASLLGVATRSADDPLDELVLRFDPPGVRVRYTRGRVELTRV